MFYFNHNLFFKNNKYIYSIYKKGKIREERLNRESKWEIESIKIIFSKFEKKEIMKKILAVLLFGFIPFLGMSQCQVYGKIKIVDSFEDYKVKIVDSFEDVKIKQVNSFSDQVGRWEIVDSFEDYKIKFVDSFEDFTIKFVDSFEGCD